MNYGDVEKEFLQFQVQHKNNTFNKLSDFFNQIRTNFEQEKNTEYIQQGLTSEQANQKSRQSWVAFLGSALERIILLSIEDTCKKHNLKIATDKVLKSNNLDPELDVVKRSLLVDF
ncbi:MAG: hypothetical protein LBG52_03020 [Candidatus Peribacteria bacterium]|jgi:hypothetical protein|nr:hypothetical protein [Candidatus Peribacteria bacterium]